MPRVSVVSSSAPKRAAALPGPHTSRQEGHRDTHYIDVENALRDANHTTTTASIFGQHKYDRAAKLGQRRHLYGRRRTAKSMARAHPPIGVIDRIP